MKEELKNILQILIEHEILTAKQIHNKLKLSKYGKTYQNTCTLLKKLTEEEVLKKTNLKYSIEESWFDKQIQLYEKLKELKKSRGVKVVFNDSKLKIVSVNSLKKLNEIWISLINNEIKREKPKDVFWEGPNCWWIFTNLSDEMNYIKELKKAEIVLHFLIKSENKLNRETEKFYNSNNCKAKIVSDKTENKDLHRGIINDLVLEVSYPKVINDFFDEVYSSEQQQVFLEKIGNIEHFKEEIVLKIYKNKEYARNIINEMSKLFDQ